MMATEEQDPLQYEISDKIRLVRESKRLSQEYVANKLQISQQMYSRMEANPDDAPLHRIRRLCEVLQVPIGTLTGEKELNLQQNFHQQGGQAATLMYVTGVSEEERKAYENHIADLRKQVALLEELLKLRQ